MYAWLILYLPIPTCMHAVMLGGTVQLWIKPLANGDKAIAVVNLGVFDGDSFPFVLHTSDFGFSQGTLVSVRDVLLNKPGPASTATISGSLRPYDIICYRLTPQQL